MNYLKNKIFGIMFVIGFIIILGSAGKSDYMDEIGEYYSFGEMLKYCGMGLVLMIPYSVKCAKEW